MILYKHFFLMLMAASLIGCQSIMSENNSQKKLTEPDLQVEEIESYFVTHLGEAAYGGQVFCAYDRLATEQNDQHTTDYLWLLCQEFYQEEQQLKEGTGISLPVALTYENQEGNWRILGHQNPRDGSHHGEDIKVIFPRNIWGLISPSSNEEISAHNNRVDRLQNATFESAKAYFDSVD
jgi:hypothetical protein